MLPQMSEQERARLRELALAVQRGEYDDDRRPAEPRWVVVGEWIVGHAGALILSCWLAGIVIAILRLLTGY